ncbi:MAG: preprotein translocase subunit SecG [Peptostreptococcaceae bacterium]
MRNVLMGFQIILALCLIFSIMPQDTKNIVPAQFGSEEGNQEYFKPKGKDAFLARTTKISAVLFFVNALALLLI